LQEVYALLKFLKHEPWCESGFWKAAIISAMNRKEEDSTTSTTAASPGTSRADNNDANDVALSPTGMMIALDRVRRLLSPLILRRTKDSLGKDGKPILTLPPVETKIVSVELSSAEREFYNTLLAMSQSVFEGFIEAGTANKSWFQIFSLLHRLRQACDHVALTVKGHMEDWNPVGEQQQESQETKAAAKSSNGDGISEGFIEGLLQKFKAQQSTETENNGDKNDLTYASKVAETLLEAVKSGAERIEDECKA
jgi:DNA repair protein RAD5